jgi:hypothetical protein
MENGEDFKAVRRARFVIKKIMYSVTLLSYFYEHLSFLVLRGNTPPLPVLIEARAGKIFISRKDAREQYRCSLVAKISLRLNYLAPLREIHLVISPKNFYFEQCSGIPSPPWLHYCLPYPLHRSKR